MFFPFKFRGECHFSKSQGKGVLFAIKVLLRDVFESLICWLDHWLSCMLDYIHVNVFHISKNWFYKLAQHLLDTSSTPCCLSSFFSCFLSLSRQLLDTWWIDQESSSLFDSFSTPSGSIELLFLDLMSYSSIPQLLTTFSSIPPSIASLIHASIELYWGSIYLFLRDLILISSIFLNLSAPVHLPNTISLTPNLFLCDFSSFFKFFLLLVSF